MDYDDIDYDEGYSMKDIDYNWSNSDMDYGSNLCQTKIYHSTIYLSLGK